MTPRTTENRPGLDPARSRTTAWLLTGLIVLSLHGALFAFTMPLDGLGAYLLYQASYLALLSVLGVGLTHGWRALAPELPARLRWIRWPLIWLGSVGLGALALAPDLENLSVRLGGENNALVLWVLVGVVAGLLPIAFFAASRLIRQSRGLAIATGIGAVGLLAADEFILDNGYPGAHLYLFITGFVVLYLAVPGTDRPKPWGLPLLGLGGVLAAFSFWAPPGNRTRLSIASMDSASLAKLISPTQRRTPVAVDAPEAARALAAQHPEWFAPRPVAEFTAAPLADEGIVILVTIDALRADLFSVPRRARDVQAFKELAVRGTYFERVFSPSTTTRFALGAMLTGTDTTRLDWHRRSISQPVLTAGNPKLLTERLQSDGVRTIVGMPNPHQYGPKSGFAKGIDELERFEPPKGQRYALSEPVITWMLERLARVERGERVFLYAHLLDPHAPYDSVTKRGRKFERYLAEVRAVGKQMKRLWQGLAKLGIRDRVVLIISADHGESFGRHGQYVHNNVAYEDSAKVPLIVVGPGIKRQSVQETVSLNDLTPTILELFGTEPAHARDGRSLTPTLMQGTPPIPRPQISANYNAGAVLFPDQHKLVLQHKLGTVELYNVETDPQEKQNLCLDDPVLCDLYLSAAEQVKGGPWPGTSEKP